MAIKIDTHIPPPSQSKTVARLSLEALAASPVGASVLITGSTAARVTALVTATAGRGWASVRASDDGVRVWKVAETPLTEAHVRAARKPSK